MSETVQIPKGWELKRLSELITDFEKRNPTLNPNKEFKYVEIGSVSDQKKIQDFKIILGKDAPSRARNVIRENDVIYGTTRPYYRNVVLITKEFENEIASTGFCVLRAENSILLSKYLFYYLLSDMANEQIVGPMRGEAYPAVSNKNVVSIDISLPPLPTQKKIVQKLDHILGQLEEKKKEISELINKNKKNIQTLTEQLQGEYISKIFESKQVLQNSQIKRLDEICIINPSKQEINDMDDKTQVSFIPMKLVDDKEGIITSTEIRNLGDVKKGYTYFKENDVIFAKITPCMENGKCAIGIGLENGIAFGSTEFHVFRVNDDVLPEWIYYFLRQYKLKREAEKNMTGTAGQKRVPKEFLASCKIPVPSKKIQREMIKKFVESSDKIFSNTKSLNSILDNHENLLKQLDNSQSSILDAAFSGKLVK